MNSFKKILSAAVALVFIFSVILSYPVLKIHGQEVLSKSVMKETKYVENSTQSVTETSDLLSAEKGDNGIDKILLYVFCGSIIVIILCVLITYPIYKKKHSEE